MKKLLYKTLCAVLAVVIAVTALPAASAAGGTPKAETVYVNLGQGGGADDVYVVSAFDMADAGTIVDYGDYSELKNLTSTEPMAYAHGMSSITVPEGRFYCQGRLTDTALPWMFDITYLLDGREISADALAGADGALEIRIGVAPGADRYKAFYDNYALQLSYSLDADKCSGVKSNNATLSTVGNTVNVAFTVMQAAEPAVYALSAQVTDFEMSAIQIRAVHSNAVSLDTDSYFDKIDDAQAQFTELADGTLTLAEASQALGAASSRFLDGLDSFNSGVQEIAGASAQLSAGLTGLSASMADASAASAEAQALAQSLLSSEDPQVQALAKACLAQAAALQAGAGGLDALSHRYAAFDAGLQALPGKTASMTAGYGKLNSGISELSTGLTELSTATAAIPGEIGTMRTQLEESLGRYMSADFEPVSFVSEKNTAESVLFIMRSDKIVIPEPVPVVQPSAEPETFWEKLLDLFGLFKA